MRIVEIIAQDNGAHRNQAGSFATVPAGWAVIPDSMSCENFPFGEVEAKEIDGVMTVTKWTAGTLPEPQKEDVQPTEVEQLRADVDYLAIMTGVEL